MNGNISFDSNSLQTYTPTSKVGIITNVIEHTDIPIKDMPIYAIADANASAIPAINYPSKTIPIAGAIVGSSQANLDSRIDSFKAYFNGKDKNLDITYGSGTRRYIASANSIKISRQQNQLWATFEIEFVCTLPFGIDTSPTVITNTTGHTTASLTVNPTITGSAPYQLPVITITIDSLTGDGDYIQISNNNNGQDLLLLGLGLDAGDVVVIDCTKREVTVNGDLVDYVGSFLELDLGSNSITYSDGFATRDVDILINYNKRWL